jgi:orotidine-5'-phosphate decarboxylase
MSGSPDGDAPSPGEDRTARGPGAIRGGNVGLVVGATFPEALAAVRVRAPSLPILLPGVGAQGGAVQPAVAAGLDARGRGLLVSSSRGIIYAHDPAAAARELRDRVNAAREAVHAAV